MKKYKEVEQFLVKEIDDNMVCLLECKTQTEREVPKYKLPLGIETGQYLTITEIGMYEVIKQ